MPINILKNKFNFINIGLRKIKLANRFGNALNCVLKGKIYFRGLKIGFGKSRKIGV